MDGGHPLLNGTTTSVLVTVTVTATGLGAPALLRLKTHAGTSAGR